MIEARSSHLAALLLRLILGSLFIAHLAGAAHFWWVRKGFYFTAAGCELPLLWAGILLVQALLGDGPYAVKIAVPPLFARLCRTT